MSSAKLVPELLVSNHAASRDFYVRIIGFSVRYERPAEKFSYLDLAGAALMIEQETDFWTTAPRERPSCRASRMPASSCSARSRKRGIAATIPTGAIASSW